MEGISKHATWHQIHYMWDKFIHKKCNLLKMYVGFAIRLTKQLGANILPLVTSARIAYFLLFDWVTALQSNVDPTDREPTEVVVRYWFELPSCL